MTRHDSTADWHLVEEVGGLDQLETIVTDFYERSFDDPIIGFLFESVELDHIVEMQIDYLRARLGAESFEYTGDSIRRAHRDLPITVGQFDRRHELLKEVLDDYDLPEHVHEAWIELDASLRDLVLQTGRAARDDMLDRGEE